jgi:hypothetical protein
VDIDDFEMCFMRVTPHRRRSKHLTRVANHAGIRTKCERAEEEEVGSQINRTGSEYLAVSKADKTTELDVKLSGRRRFSIQEPIRLGDTPGG